MKTQNSIFSLLLSVVVIELSVDQSVCQDQKTTTLEQRVVSLEQRVRQLEYRLNNMVGGRVTDIQRTKLTMLAQITNILTQARQYRLRPASVGGGAGSYAGFTLSPALSQTDAAVYIATASDTGVVVVGRSVSLNGTVQGFIDRNERMGKWEYSGDFAEIKTIGVPEKSDSEKNRETMVNDMNNIAAHMYQFRIRPHSMGGGGGSYLDYAPPQPLASTNTGTYSFSLTDVSGVIEGRSKLFNASIRVTIDSNGKLSGWEFEGDFGGGKKRFFTLRTPADSIRVAIEKDFADIASRAYQFRIGTVANGGGGGKYTGYLSAQTTSYDGSAMYAFHVEPDTVIFTATSTHGFGIVSAKIDGSGRLTDWKYTGEFAK